MRSATGTGDGERIRAVIVADGRVVGEVIADRITDHHVDATLVDWPVDASRHDDVRRLVGGGSFDVAVGLCSLDRPDRLRALQTLVARSPVPWLVLSDDEPGWRWGLAIEAGATAVLPLSSRLEDLLRGVRAVVAGRGAMPEELRERVLRERRHGSGAQQAAALRVDRLTPSEMAVLDLLHQGRSVREIALATGMVESTVRSNIKRLRAVLGVESQLAAVAVYRRALNLLLPQRSR